MFTIYLWLLFRGYLKKPHIKEYGTGRRFMSVGADNIEVPIVKTKKPEVTVVEYKRKEK